MDEDLLVSAAAAASVLCLSMMINLGKSNRVTRRKVWSKPWIKRRNEQGGSVLKMLNEELKTEDRLAYKNYLRMSNVDFEYIYSQVKKCIEKEDTHLRESISARNRLEVTLRFLATGESYRSLMYATRIHESTISKFVPEVCLAIYTNLKEKYLKTPNTREEWEIIAEDFNNMMQFPQCLGALDGRHIKFRAPVSDGSYYYNYKGDHSIVLLGLATARYKFSYVNVGVNGRISDGGVFNASKLSSALFNNSLNLPHAKELPGRNMEVPYVIVADDAFALSTKVMKPYPNRNLTHDCRIFNYRLSRARRIIENTFGILANRFRILLNPINLSASKVEMITLACVTLHNYLIEKNATNYVGNDIENTSNPLAQIVKQGCKNKSTTTAHKIRDEFKDYFVSPQGKIEWQEEAILKHNL